MKIFALCSVFIFFTGVLAKSASLSRSGSADRTQRYRKLLSEYFSQPRHPFVNEGSWLYARYGVENELTQIIKDVPSVQMQIQNFRTEVFVEKNIPAEVTGENIIVTFQGSKYGTGEDEILLVGSHYDSDSTTLGISDNGSGVVAMLEVARTLADLLRAGKIQLKFTVIFVAFDVQKLEHEITGTLDTNSGSHYFVREILDGILTRQNPPRFKGAIILDSILNYNNSAFTQILPEGFSESFPKAFQSIVKQNYTGNYLALVSKENLRSSRLDYMFSEHWTAVDTKQKFPVVVCEILRSTATTASFEFLKQDHLAFWNYLQNNQAKPLPAILLTDTGKWRAMPSQCSRRNCTVEVFLDDDRLALLDQTVMTVNRVISHNQFDVPYDSSADANSGARSYLNIISMATVTLLALLLS